MKKQRTQIISAIIALVLAVAWVAPVADGDTGGDCLTCAQASIPDPDGGSPSMHQICLDFGGYTGYSACFECVNCAQCIMMFRCYWP